MFGINVANSGRTTNMTSPRTIKQKKGINADVTLERSRPLIACSTKRLKPTGGRIHDADTEALAQGR